MSDPAGDQGYLGWDPFTDAQDYVGPFKFEDVRLAGDSVMVLFSRDGYKQKRDSTTLVMRRVDMSWRIANFMYSADRACDRDLAAGLVRYARKIAAKLPIDGSC